MHVIGLMYEDSAAATTLQHTLGGLPGIDVQLFRPPGGHLEASHLDVLVTDCADFSWAPADGGNAPADYVLVVASGMLMPRHERPGQGMDFSLLLAEVVRAAATAPQAESGGDASLSERERQVLLCIGDGYTHDQTARRLGISTHTVDTYVKRVRSKLGLGNKAELARAAIYYT